MTGVTTICLRCTDGSENGSKLSSTMAGEAASDPVEVDFNTQLLSAGRPDRHLRHIQQQIHSSDEHDELEALLAFWKKIGKEDTSDALKDTKMSEPIGP